MSLIYKLLDRPAWDAATAEGMFKGSELDLADGFIHFSSAPQAAETARRYFSGRDDLVLVAVDTGSLGAALRWEPSRGGALFPHLYGTLAIAHVTAVHEAPLDATGAPALAFLE